MKGKFAALFSTNFFGVLNDNFLKSLACFIAIRWVATEDASFVISAAAACLVLPYIFLSPLAGKWAYLFPKKQIVVYCKIAEIPIMAIAIAGFALQSVGLVIFSIFLMGTQSALYSPAKYGLIREVGGAENLPFGVGGFEAVSFFGMLSGTLIAAFLSDTVPLLTLYILLVIFAVAGLVLSVTIHVKQPYKGEDEPNSVNPLRFLKDTHRKAKKYNGLNTLVFGLSLFWWLVASLQIGLMVYCQMTMGLSPWHTGILLSLAAVGVTAGCFLAGILEKKAFIYRWVVPSALGISFLLLILFFAPMPPLPFGCILFVISLLCGFFKVPLDTSIQQKVEGAFLATILAYFNQVSFIFILFSSATLSLVSLFLPSKYLFLVLGIVFFCVPTYLAFGLRPLLCYCTRWILHWRYKVTVKGLENIQKGKTYLILPNHQAVADPVILFSQFYNEDIRPLVDEIYFTSPLAGSMIRLFNGIPVPDLERSREGVSQAMALEGISLNALKERQTILLYPSGRITVDGVERIGDKQLAYKLCKELPQNVEVLGVRISGLWGSVWSRYGGKSTPPLLPTLFKVLLTGKIFQKRRKVNLEVVNITEQVKEWSQGEKLDFNKSLERFYNV